MCMDTTRFRTLTLLVLALASTVLLTGCFGDELVGPYDGPDKIAFSFDLVSEPQASDQPAAITVTEPATISLTTELIGPQRSSETTVNYGTVAETINYVKEVPTDTGGVRLDTTVLATPTTADPGTHFDFAGEYVLPADTSAASFAVDILDGIPSGGEPVQVALRLDGNPADNLEPAETMRYLTINILPN